MLVRRVLSALALTPLVLAGLAAPSVSAPRLAAPADARVGTGSWSPLTSSVSPNFAQAAVARTADGSQHVVWLVDNPDRTHHYEHTAISPTGVQGPVTRILPTNWAQLSTPVDLGVNADGSLRLAFRGSIDGGTADFFSYKGVYTAVSADGGATWAVPREVLAKSIGDGGVTLAYAPGGTPVTGYGDTGGFHWNVGTVPEAAVPTATVQEFTDHDAMGASLVTSGVSVYVVYQSTRANGIFARQIWPTLGAPLQAPGTYTNPGQPMAVVDRPGVGPVAAYTINSKVVLWDVLANVTHAVRGMDGPNNVALAGLPDGHLWVAAQGPIGYTPRASRVSASGWNIDRSPALLDDMYSTFGLEVSSAGALRAELILTANDSGDPTRIHAQSVEAQMTVKASPRRWRVGRAQRVVFKVTDVDGAVAGAKVRAAGKRCVTNGSGKCKIRFPASSRPRRIKAKVTKSGYVDTIVWLKVKR
jgi:hypothetical protein